MFCVLEQQCEYGNAVSGHGFGDSWRRSGSGHCSGWEPGFPQHTHQREKGDGRPQWPPGCIHREGKTLLRHASPSSPFEDQPVSVSVLVPGALSGAEQQAAGGRNRWHQGPPCEAVWSETALWGPAEGAEEDCWPDESPAGEGWPQGHYD